MDDHGATGGYGRQPRDGNARRAGETRRATVRPAATSLLVLYALTTVHHLYGGIADGSANRLHAPVLLAVPVGVALAALVAYRRTGRRSAALAFTTLVVALGVLLGGVHSAYSHLYKDLVYLADGPAELYVLLNPDEHYPPDDLFFEVTGVVELGVAVWAVVCALRLLRTAPRRSRGTALAPAGGR